MPSLALYQPDIPQNAGALLRLTACLGVSLEVIEPCGFLWDDRKLRRAGMDYIGIGTVVRHPSFAAFETEIRAKNRRLLLLTTSGDQRFDRVAYNPGDVLMMGRESAGVPEDVAARADLRLRIPMAPGLRSLNVALAATLVLGEALRQLNAFPD